MNILIIDILLLFKDIRTRLQEIINERKEELNDLKVRRNKTKLYIHSQIPLDDELPMEVSSK